MSNKKNNQLGMNFGTASNRLRKIIMFELIKRLNLDTCYQCGCKIDNANEFSVEHKIPWLDSENASGLFFDLDNIAFSHLKCNSGAKRSNHDAEKIKIKAINILTLDSQFFDSMTDANIKLGIPTGSISRILQKKRKTAKGYTFEFA